MYTINVHNMTKIIFNENKLNNKYIKLQQLLLVVSREDKGTIILLQSVFNRTN